MLERMQMHDMLSSERPSLNPPPSERSGVTSIDSCHDSEPGPVVCVEKSPGSNSSQDGDAARILGDSTSSIKESGQPLCTAGYQDGVLEELEPMVTLGSVLAGSAVMESGAQRKPLIRLSLASTSRPVSCPH